MNFKSLPKKIREKNLLFINLRKFDETVVNMLNSSGFIDDVEERGEFVLMPEWNARHILYNTTDKLSHMEINNVRLYNQDDIVQSLDKVTNFKYEVRFNFNDIQPQNAINCLLFFYNIFTFVAKKYLHGGKPNEIRIKSTDNNEKWGSRVFINIHKEVLEALKNKNKNQTIHTVEYFQRMICGQEDDESLEEYYSDTIYSQTIL